MVPIVYNDDIIVSHSIARHCLCLLDEISQKDYKKVGIFSNKIKCLSLDDYEAKFCGGSKDNTMDAAVGISDYQKNRKVNHRLLLVELRLEYQSIKNLDKSPLIRKIKHSRDLLSGSEIDQKSCFIFSDKVAPQAKSWVARLSREFSSNWETMNPTQFNDYIKFESDMPYQSENDLDKIKEELSQRLEKKDLKGFFEISKYWRMEALKYKSRFKLLESAVILKTLWNVWEPLDISVYSSDEMVMLEGEIEKEDLQMLIS